MAVTFIPEIWSAKVLDQLFKSLVYAGPQVVNRDWEGDITAVGDTVRIQSWGNPTISSYTTGTTLSYEELSDAQRALLIDQAKSFSFKVDDLTKAQTSGALENGTKNAAYGLRDVADQYVASLYTGAASANQLGTISVTTAAGAFTVLRKLRTALNKANVPTEGRYAILPAFFEGLLIEDDRIIRADASGSTEALRNGLIGRALGFNLFVSNNAPNPTGDDWVVQAGHPSAIAYAEQILETEAIRLQLSFGTGVRGLHAYGAKLVQPAAIATCIASET